MTSLEKYMFFIPNRWTVRRDEIYMSFNISNIPEDMEVTSMELVLPLPEGVTEGKLWLQAVSSAWEEKNLSVTRPALAVSEASLSVAPDMTEARFSLTHYAFPWRFRSFENHGVYVRVDALEGNWFEEETPPYLLVATV